MSDPMAEPMMRPNEAALILLQQLVGQLERVETSVGLLQTRAAFQDGEGIAKRCDDLKTGHEDLRRTLESMDDRVRAMEQRSRPLFAAGGKMVEQVSQAAISALIAGMIAWIALSTRHPAAPPAPTAQSVTASVSASPLPALPPVNPLAPQPPDRAPVGQSVQLPAPSRKDP